MQLNTKAKKHMTESDQLRTLANPVRINILSVLSEKGSMPASEIMQKIDSDPSVQMLSAHLSKLRISRLVSMDRRANKPVYTVNKEAMLSIVKKLEKLTH